jgi:predicted DNA-binding transcriptional regulator AlpA
MELLTVQGFSDLTGLSVETLNQWRSRNVHIPWIKIGRAVRYLRKDVEAYLWKCRVVPPDFEEAR